MEDFDEFPKEFSCYGANIQALSSIPELTSDLSIKKLRVLHCPKLISMQGIEQLTNLIEINLSSNSIQRIEGLHDMKQLRILDLSCNGIRVINGLSELFSLEKLNLSFNKISSLYNLRQLYGPQYPNFKQLDIRGNNISQLSELRYLAGCQSLEDVAFQSQNGANPVCKMPEYSYTVLQCVPKIKYLDQQMVNPQRAQPSPPKIREEENIPPPQNKSPEPIKITQPEPIKESPKTKENKIELIETQPINNDQIYKQEVIRLQQANNDLYEEYKDICYKFQVSEEYWIQRTKSYETGLAEAKYERIELEKECKKLRKSCLAKEAQVSGLEEDLKRAHLAASSKDKMLEDLHSQVASMMKDLGECQRVVQQTVDDTYRKQEKLKILEKQNMDLKNELKSAQTALTQIHSQSLESASQALKRYEELQNKYDDLCKNLENKEEELIEIKRKNYEILEMNAKFDENWSIKFKDAIQNRENMIASLKQELQNISQQEKEKTQNLIYAEKEELRQKIYELEKKLSNCEMQLKNKDREKEIEINEIGKDVADLREMLKMSVNKEASSRELIGELTELIKDLQLQLDKEITEKNKFKLEGEQKSGKLEEELAVMKGKFQTLKEKYDAADKTLSQEEDQSHLKNREISKLKRELTEAKEFISELEDASKAIKNKCERTEKNLLTEIAALEAKSKELDLTLGTKNAIIEDQNDAIRDLKDINKQLEEELQNFQNNKNQYKENYENKLQDAYDETEKIKNKLSLSEEYISELENKIEELEGKRNDYIETIEKLEKQLEEKSEMIDAIEEEVKNLQEEKETQAQKKIEEKELVIKDLKLFRDELNASLAMKNKECIEKTKIIKELEIELDKTRFDLQDTKKNNNEMQEEIRILLTEMDNQKKQASEKLAQLTRLFS
ncbi:unnamed protein product [Blepharisma stoltei]|uniref:Uncharacterized protein n=1 Tax=Blepharisma stoltei TaxID=1481888 RepID=A0AAU9JNL0_9CILI|nr:unnamed protein product [Blepharisma stoltei]